MREITEESIKLYFTPTLTSHLYRNAQNEFLFFMVAAIRCDE